MPLYSESVDQDAITRPGCEPFDMHASGVRHAVPEAPKVTRREVTSLLLGIVAAGGALVVVLECEHLWQLGGWLGLGMGVVQGAAGVGLGAFPSSIRPFAPARVCRKGMTR